MPLPAPPDLTNATAARLALVSDTHIYPSGARSLPPQVIELFERAVPDLIVHAGDICTGEVLDLLATVAPVVAVRGNNDSGAFGASLPMHLRLTVATRSVMVLHGHGLAGSARKEAAANSAGHDVVIYGHSHIPIIERQGETVMVNPGSPTDRRFQPHFGVALLDISVERIWPELILFSAPRDLAGAVVPPR